MSTAQNRPSAGEPAQFRMVLVSFLAGGIGLLAGGVAFILYRLIGSSKIKGHGIPEAMEAVLFNRSRIQIQKAL